MKQHKLQWFNHDNVIYSRGRITSNHIAALNFFLIRYENRLI